MTDGPTRCAEALARRVKRTEVIGDCVLYLGDALEILPLLGKVDAVVTDIPYGISVKGAKNVSPNGTRNYDFFPGDDDWKAQAILAKESTLLAIASLPKTFVMWCGHRQIGNITEVLESAGYATRMIFWRKKCPAPCAPGSGFATAVECAVYGYLPSRTWHGSQYEFNIFEADNYRYGQPGKVEHPTQKPLSLMQWNIQLLTNPGDVVLDCFAGSFTTGVACAKMGRRFIGIEREEKYFDIGVKRITDAYRQGDFLRDMPPVPKPQQQALPLL